MSNNTKLNQFERGMVAGAEPFGRAYEEIGKNFSDIGSHVDDVDEKYDNIISALHPNDYAEIRKRQKKEKEELNSAILLFMRNNVKDAYAIFDNLIKNNCAAACYYNGDINYYGYSGYPVNILASVNLFEIGADNNDVLCKLKLAEFFPNRLSRGCSQTDMYRNVQKNIRKLAESGSAISPIYQYEMGHMYEYGLNFDINPEMAFRYYKMAAEAKYFKGIFALYKCYAEGFGVEEDLNKARLYLDECNKMGYKG